MKKTKLSITVSTLLCMSAILFAMNGCKPDNKGVSTYIDFPEEKILKAVTIELDTALFRYPFRIRTHKDRAVVMDLHNADYYYHLFEYPGFTYLSSFGKRGSAPDEVLMPENCRFIENEKDEIWTLDSSKSRITRLGYSSSRDSLLLVEAVALDKDILRPLDFCLYNDSVMIIPDYSGESRLWFVNTSGKVLRKFGQIPTTNTNAQETSKPVLSQAWRSFVDYNPRTNILASVTQLGEVLEIYNFNDSTHRVILGPNGEPDFQEMQGYAMPAGIMGFSDICMTDNHIYAVFHGRKFKDMTRDPNNIVDGGQFIYVFDLQGNPVRKYIVDRYINGLHVNEQTQIAYATDVNSDQPLICFAL